MQQRDLRAELLQAEAAHFAKKRGVPVDEPIVESAPKRQIERPPGGDDGGMGEIEEDPEAKRRRVLEETRDIDADSDGSEDDSSEDEGEWEMGSLTLDGKSEWAGDVVWCGHGREADLRRIEW